MPHLRIGSLLRIHRLNVDQGLFLYLGPVKRKGWWLYRLLDLNGKVNEIELNNLIYEHEILT